MHRRQRLEQVGAQRLHRAMAARRGRAAARRALRPRRAPGDPRRGARRGAVHGADRVPHHRQARRAAADADAARPRRGRRGAQPRGPARLARRHGPVGPRRLRPDRDRADHRDADRPGGHPGLHGPPAAGHRRLGRGRRARARPVDGADLLPRLPGRQGAERPMADWRPRHAGRRRLPVLRGPRRRRDHLRRLPDRPLRGRVGAGRAPRGGRGRRRLRPRRRARRGGASRDRPARRPRARPTRWRASCRTTSRPRPRRTSTRGSSTSPASCPRRRAARSAAPPCVSSPRSRAGSARPRRRRWRR